MVDIRRSACIEKTMKNNKKSQRTLLLLFAVFVVPLLVAMAMFAMRGQWSITNPISHGQLIYPAQPISSFEFSTATQSAGTREYLQTKWTYFLYIPATCNLECEAALFKVRQTIRSMGKDINRIQYMMLSEPSKPPIIDQRIMQRHPQLVVGQLTKWQTEVDVEKRELLEAGVLYIIDPLGNLMMRYDMNATSKGMLKDLKKLLRTSNIG